MAPEPADPILEALQQQADKHLDGVPVTLLIDGALVSGVLASAEVFTEANRRGLEDSAKDIGPTSDEAEQEARDGLLRAVHVFEGREDEAQQPPTYVHLSDVTVHAGGALVHMAMWRGRIARVSGWTLGGPEAEDE